MNNSALIRWFLERISSYLYFFGTIEKIYIVASRSRSNYYLRMKGKENVSHLQELSISTPLWFETFPRQYEDGMCHATKLPFDFLTKKKRGGVLFHCLLQWSFTFQRVVINHISLLVILPFTCHFSRWRRQSWRCINSFLCKKQFFMSCAHVN